jgi:penicillin-binding protein 1C
VIKRRVQFANETGRVEASRDEWFVRGTEPSTATQTWIAARAGNAAGARIVSPTDGTIIALDPDIPAARQRIALTSGDTAQAACWEVNGEALGCNADAVSWQPVAGNFTVRLLDEKGEERDRVTLIVRGKLKS